MGQLVYKAERCFFRLQIENITEDFLTCREQAIFRKSLNSLLR